MILQYLCIINTKFDLFELIADEKIVLSPKMLFSRLIYFQLHFFSSTSFLFLSHFQLVFSHFQLVSSHFQIVFSYIQRLLASFARIIDQSPCKIEVINSRRTSRPSDATRIVWRVWFLCFWLFIFVCREWPEWHLSFFFSARSEIGDFNQLNIKYRIRTAHDTHEVRRVRRGQSGWMKLISYSFLPFFCRIDRMELIQRITPISNKCL